MIEDLIGVIDMDFKAKHQEERVVKSNHYVAVLAILNALPLCFSNSFAQVGEAKGGTSHRGGQANSHMSSRGLENTNAQWSADPERGWLRAGERHDVHDQRHSEGKSNQNRGKHKSHGPKGKVVNKSTK